MNLSDLTASEKIAAGGGLLLLIGSFLPWYSLGGLGISGWGSGFLAWAGILAGVAGAAVLVAPRMGGSEISAGSLSGPQLAVVLGGAGTALIVLRLLTMASFVSIGVFAGLVGAGAVTYGSFRAMQEAGLELPVDEVRERFARHPQEPSPEQHEEH